MECSLCTSINNNPHCPMCRAPPHPVKVDQFLITNLTTYLAVKYPDQSSEDIHKMASHLAEIVTEELENFQ